MTKSKENIKIVSGDNKHTEAKVIDEKSILIGDGLQNLVASLGNEGDKRAFSTFVNKKFLSRQGNETELNAMYRTDWASGKVVDIIPNDMTREWRSFTGELEPTVIEKLVEEEDRLELRNKINLAHRWARLYGTAFIVMSVDDGNPPEMPLEIDKIKPNGLRYINVVDRTRLNYTDVQPQQDPLKPNYGYPEYYRFAETNTRIHWTRLIRFDGIPLPYEEFRKNNYYSDSVLDRLYDSLTNFNTTTNSSASMVYEGTVDIIKLKSLMNMITTAEGEENVRKRLSLAKLLKSFNNVLLLDSDEEYDSKQNTTFTGLKDLIVSYAEILASASDIPATRLLGTSPGGLNATGESDLRNYYDKIRADQNTEYKPKLDYFDTIMAASLGMSSDADLSYTFNPLYQLTPEQQATVDFNNAQRDATYYDREIITGSTVAKELKENGTYSNITDEHIEELEEYENGIGSNSPDFSIDPEREGTQEENEEGEGAEDPEES